ncbi:hypothetical protein GCM10007216_20270 [Thalassobacillus devorans]|uniref:Tripartite ATP-independent periplasmic transporters DctQ component domain-containing protein n=1 Tax=Thalassobacillus devorans TaxID=279813 RepID=A0ABQ1P234_9BACI|nr:TRAP transporter small permease subunit [Thalassobacillus devorans]NIK28029.1 TRAP-type C4-dicarboxylate transport system permease small subunit [Thalassobacillus devorans]GGC89467.1 hypothetical protein GCM10007216_20270 [Thalassobacillus devorans]
MRSALKIYRVFEWIKLIGIWISGISLFGMMMFIVVDVVLRNVLSDSINGGFEFVQNYFMPLAVFPALAYVYSSGVLPRMDLVLDKFSVPIKRILIFIMVLLEIFILGLIVQFTWEYAVSGLEREMSFPAAGSLYPLYPLFFLIPLSFALIIVENLFILFRNIIERKPSFLFKEK